MAKHSTDQVRAYLREKEAQGLWKPAKPVDEYKPGYLSRLARGFQAQEAAGLPINRQAARGHATTKEHANRKAAPQLAEYKAVLRPARAPRAAKPTKRLLGPILREHVRPPSIPASIGHLRDSYDAVVSHTGTTPQSATSFLYAVLQRQLTHDEEHWRVVVSGYDCEQGRWGEAFANRKRSPGATIAFVMEQWKESGSTFADFLLAAINDSDSPTSFGNRGLQHLCLFQVMAYRNYGSQRRAG